MTKSPVARSRALFVLVLVAGCAGRITPAGSEPTDFNTFPSRQPREVASTHGTSSHGIYHEVLQFYRPAGGNMRWLDRALLHASRDQPETDSLGVEFASTLIDELGALYCLLERRAVCRRAERGGTIRMSPVYFTGSDTARVVVRYTSVDPYASPESSTMVFLLEGKDDKWRIRSRGSARND